MALDEVYIDRDGAEEISVEAGDVIGVPVGPGQMEQFTIKAITEAYYVKQVEHRLVLMTSLAHAQVITGKEGLISAVMVSNLGEGDEGHRPSPPRFRNAWPIILSFGKTALSSRRSSRTSSNLPT